jgi:hypothetical protein
MKYCVTYIRLFLNYLYQSVWLKRNKEERKREERREERNREERADFSCLE